VDRDHLHHVARTGHSDVEQPADRTAAVGGDHESRADPILDVIVLVSDGGDGVTLVDVKGDQLVIEPDAVGIEPVACSRRTGSSLICGRLQVRQGLAAM
jgi:hypothetical protein